MAEPIRYQGVGTGPGWARDFEARQAVPVSQTQKGLSDPTVGSPFIIRIAPPDVLLGALAGGGASRPGTVFDRLLADQRAAVASSIPSGATLTEQQQTLLGTRVPASPRTDIISTAMNASSNFSRVKQRQAKTSALLKKRGDDSDVPVALPLISARGEKFSYAQNTNLRTANQSAIADRLQVRGVLSQLRQILETPPLILLVNPQNLTLTFTKKQSYQDRSRYNYIFQPWGEDQPKLSVQGKTGAFMTGAAAVDNEGQPLSTTGVQWASRRDSAAFRDLANLITLYRNNGYIYDLLGRSEAHWWIGHIEIVYDQVVYQGQFDSFTYSYSETSQNGGIEFGFEFTVSAMFDTCQLEAPAPIQAPSENGVPIQIPSVDLPLSTGGASPRPVATPQTEGTSILHPLFRR